MASTQRYLLNPCKVALQVIEFVAFGEQLRTSHTKAVAQTELCLLDLALHVSQSANQSKPSTMKLEDITQPGMNQVPQSKKPL